MNPLRPTLALLLTLAACTGASPPPDASPDRPLDLGPADGVAPPPDRAPDPPDVAPDATPDDLAPPPPDAATCGAAAQRCCDGATPCGPLLTCRDNLCQPCPNDDALCGGACRDITSDPANCGGCGRSCRADQRCAMGACVCADGRSSCGGACVDVQRDDAHCGRCGNACAGALPGATARCALGRCELAACDEGRADCDGVAANGCEVTLASSMAHCGRCGGRCDALPGRTVSCQEGRCVDAMACAAGLDDCSPAPGCETDLARSVVHCGACGASCSARGGVARCVAGACAITCDAGYGDCDGAIGNGCEAELAGDVAHCGACGRRCAPAHATGDCAAGRCAIGACEAGYADCDGDAGNGCEVALGGDLANCGACGRRCARAHATAVCASGRCTLGRCAEGRGDCDGDDANGCEADLADDVSHCGACGRACPGDQTCAAGACVCRAGAVSCGGECVDTRTDARHCGACGAACASGICSEGICSAATAQRSCLTAGTPGCGVVEVAAGTFSMGVAASCMGSAMPDPRTCVDWQADPIQPNLAISAFAVDAYEVTVARFRTYVRVRGQVQASLRARPVVYPGGQLWRWDVIPPLPQEVGPRCDGDCTWTAAPGAYESFPVLGADPWLAQEFCVWDGGRLPTEAEWEYVARGRAVVDEGLLPARTYPWGEAVPVADGRCDRGHVQGLCPGEAGTDFRPVGRFAPSGGVFDLAGNAVELCADTYTGYGIRDSFSTCWRNVSVRDPMCRLSPSTLPLVTRPGQQFSGDNPGERHLRAAGRGFLADPRRVGFRCVRSRP